MLAESCTVFAVERIRQMVCRLRQLGWMMLKRS